MKILGWVCAAALMAGLALYLASGIDANRARALREEEQAAALREARRVLRQPAAPGAGQGWAPAPAAPAPPPVAPAIPAPTAEQQAAAADLRAQYARMMDEVARLPSMTTPDPPAPSRTAPEPPAPSRANIATASASGYQGLGDEGWRFKLSVRNNTGEAITVWANVHLVAAPGTGMRSATPARFDLPPYALDTKEVLVDFTFREAEHLPRTGAPWWQAVWSESILDPAIQ